MDAEPHLREQALSLVEAMVRDQLVTPEDLGRFVRPSSDSTDPECLRQEMESWYRTLGIEVVTGRPFSLKRPYYTSEELAEAYARQEIVLCVPKGVTRQQFGMLFNLSSWAFRDELVADTVETEDFWCKTKRSLVPEYLDMTGTQVRRLLGQEGRLGMSLERYMAFVARVRHLTGETPDVRHGVWLTRGRYDGNNMLIAGFDSHGKFSVHGWLPHFHSPRCGARYVSIPDHLYL